MASDFLKLAELAKVDTARVLEQFAEPGKVDPAPRPAGIGTVTRFLQRIARGRSHSAVARQVDRDRNTVARWLDGETEPRLPDLLRLVDALTLRLIDFVAAFADPDRLPAARSMYRDLVLQRRLAYEMPWAHAVLRVLELDVYRALPRHEPGFIARLIGIDRGEEERCLTALSKAGQIRRHREKWRVRRVIAVDTRENPAGNRALKEHWAVVGLERLRAGALDQGSLFSYNLFAISEEGLEQIRKAHLDYFERLRSIVAACEAPTRLVLANVQLVRLETMDR